MKKVPTWIYKTLQPLGAFIIRILYNPKIINKKVIPKDGPIILAGNHKHFFDPVLVTCSTRRLIHFFAKDTYLTGIRGFFLRNAGVLPVHVGKIHKDSYKAAINILKQEKPIGIFPEGTRNKTEQLLLPFRRGAVTLAKQTNTKILPFAITGEYKPFHNLTIEFGQLLDVTDLDIDEANKVLTKEIEKLLIKDKKN